MEPHWMQSLVHAMHDALNKHNIYVYTAQTYMSSFSYTRNNSFLIIFLNILHVKNLL